MTVLILGATSAIAHETARLYAASGATLALGARNPDKLRAAADDLRARGAAAVHEIHFDALDTATHQSAIDGAAGAMGGIDTALVAYGVLPDAETVHTDPDAAVESFDVNATSTISVMTRLANMMVQQGHGTLAVISSVAGDRGRPSNYVYGAAKAAVTAFASGLRARLHGTGVEVVTIKPGPVDTPMIVGVHEPGLLAASPQAVGARIHRAMEKGEGTVYTPGYWRPVMAAVRAIPDKLFKRLDW
ncbi:SDR family oxidoreductase [Rubricoccus marinus]|uniref:Short-chain dehydrogenase n=1 Tax=Rubricoccus marinus TaxID=716817 RepID=A0A259U1B6_9BACT|nr:SDR family oxidoreductase [Rubricoccus marinus]OZC03782.1 short-chain dehydrogenase [Rubricoccus marinus]